MPIKPVKIKLLKRLLEGGSDAQVINAIEKIHPADLSLVFSELSDLESQRFVDCLFEVEKAGETLKEIPEYFLPEILDLLDFYKLVAIISRLESDDAVYLMSKLPEEKWKDILEKLKPKKRVVIEKLLLYPIGTAGSIMDLDYFYVSIEDTVESSIQKLREHPEKHSVFYIYVLENKRLVGVMPLRSLVLADPKSDVKDLMVSNVYTVKATDKESKAAKLVGQYNILSIPVVDENNHMLGVITVDDVIDIFEEEATEDIYSMAGLSEVDRAFTPVRTKVKKRLPWMFINLGTASLAALVVSLFSGTIAKSSLLAAFMTIVANLGGNGGNQSLVVITRSMALGELVFSKAYKAIIKEVLNGLIVGMIAGIVAGSVAYYLQQNYYFGIILFFAMVINLVVAGFMGGIVPLIFKWFRLDPAVGSSVVVTTMTDVTGFFVFLGLAQMFIDKLVM